MSLLSQRRLDWIALALLLIAVLILFIPALGHPDNLLYPSFSSHSDLTVIHWPKAHLMAEGWQSARKMPFWTPANLSGMPLAANQLAMRFYPPAWLAMFLPINLVFNLLFVLHLVWAGLGTYCLLRIGFDLEPVPALSGALTFALGGKLLAHVAGGHVSLVGAMAWVPWALLGTHQVLRAGRQPAMVVWHWAALTAISLSMQIATHTLITLYTAYLLVAYVAWHFIFDFRFRISSLRSLILPLISIPLLSASLGAAQLLPLIELTGYSNRTLSLEQASEFALTPLTLLVGLFLPSAQGGHELVIYLGLVPLVLALVGVSRADRRSWFFVGVFLLALLFSLGTVTPFFKVAYNYLPGFRWVRTPARVFLPASLAVAVLVGIGAQRVVKETLSWSRPVAVGLGALTLALGLGLAILFGQVNRAAFGLALLPSLVLLILALLAHRRLSPRLALPALTLLLFVDLASFDLTLMHFISPDEAFATGEEVADYLAGQPGLFRTYSPSYSLPSHVAARAGLQTTDGVEPVHLAVYDRLMALAAGYADPSFSVAIPPFPADRPVNEAFRDVRPDLDLLGLLNVGYLASAFPIDLPDLASVAEIDGVYLYHNSHVLPRAWILDVTAWDLAQSQDDWAMQLARLADVSAQAVATGEHTAVVTCYDPDRIELEVRSPRDGLLILSEIWYPGWKATVDGQEEPVQQVAHVLRGVLVSGGEHHIILLYDPASVRWGTRLSLASLVGLIMWVGFRVWRRKRSKPGNI